MYVTLNNSWIIHVSIWPNLQKVFSLYKYMKKCSMPKVFSSSQGRNFLLGEASCVQHTRHWRRRIFNWNTLTGLRCTWLSINCHCNGYEILHISHKNGFVKSMVLLIDFESESEGLNFFTAHSDLIQIFIWNFVPK